VILQLLEHAVAAVSAGYLEVEQARVADEEHDVQAVVEILAGMRPPDAAYGAAMKRRGFEAATLKYCIVADPGGSDVGAVVRRLRTDLSGAVGRIGSVVVAFTSDVPAAIDGVASFGTAARRGEDSGYRHAASALRVAHKLGAKHIRYEEAVPLALVLDAPGSDREAFVEAQLGAILKDNLGPELIKSLREYYASAQSVATAARKLHVHRHTLEYRLERITKLLGSDLKDPARRLLIELALSLYDE
jgi:DNA-binding PucR family transcriptional regulator